MRRLKRSFKGPHKNVKKIPYNPENKPWAYFRSKDFFLGLFLRGLFLGGLFSGGLIFGMKFALKKGVGLLLSGIFLQQ